MNIKIKRILSCIVFLILLILAIGKCADILEHKWSRQKYEPFFESETNFDVIFLGTSHMWNSVLPMELWKEHGITSYNWGYSNCTPAESYYLVREIVDYTSPKVVVLDVYGIVEYDHYNNGKYRTDRIEQQHVQFDEIPLSRNKMEAVKDVFDDYDDRADFLWNFIMYHNRWNELGNEDFEYTISTEKGAHYLAELGRAEYKKIYQNEQMEFDSVCYDYFLKTIEFCQENDIKVLCTYLPYAAPELQQRVANSIGEIINEYPECSYVNMLDKDILNFTTDIWEDNEHLNYSGAQKVTSWLGKYLYDNYLLDDYSNDAGWKKDYQLYYEDKVLMLRNQEKLVNYLCLLRDSDFDAEIEIYDRNLSESEVLIEQIKNAGITPCILIKDEESCAKLIIKSSFFDDTIDEVSFYYEGTFCEDNVLKVR